MQNLNTGVYTKYSIDSLIATSTGIFPYHSFVHSFPTLNYSLIHRAHCFIESYKEVYNDNYFCLVTGQFLGNFVRESQNIFKMKLC